MVEVLTGQDITVEFDRPAPLQIDGETILDSMLKKGQTQDVGDLAQQLIDMGVNVKQTKPNPNYTYDEPFIPTFYVPVTVNMDSKWPPQVFWITTTGRKVPCNAENISQLDYIRVKNVNLQANLYENRNNPGQYTLYADIMYVEQDVDADPYAAQYEQREMAEPNDPNDMPF